MYSEKQRKAILKKVFQNLEDGVSLRKSLIESKIGRKAFFSWINSNEEFKNQYIEAKELGLDAKFDSIAEDYNAPPVLDIFGKIDSGWVQMQRLKIDSKKWELSKLHPKKYGSKIENTIKGDSENPLSISVEVKSSGVSVSNSENDVITAREI